MTAQAAAAILILGLLAVLATNLDVEMLSRSGGQWCCGMIFVAVTRGFPVVSMTFAVGPAIIGVLGAMDLTHIRRREWYKILINGSIDAAALLLGAAVFSLLPIPSFAATAWVIAGAAASALAYRLQTQS
ncbi:MAG: hypothetical protein U0W40_04025 [Acidimicrobiia bacterium]